MTNLKVDDLKWVTDGTLSRRDLSRLRPEACETQLELFRLMVSIVSRTFLKAVVVALVGILLVPIALLLAPLPSFASAQAFAACHEETSDSSLPPGQNHDCCLIGHDHPIPGHTPAVTPVWNLFVTELIAVPEMQSQGRPEPALTSFDPPGIKLSLRI